MNAVAQPRRFFFVAPFLALPTLTVALAVAACGPGKPSGATPTAAAMTPPTATTAEAVPCIAGAPMRVHFYDVGQALAVLVDLPDGHHILIDAGESPKRPGCGAPCLEAHTHLLDSLQDDLAGKPIDMLWITHQHSDHLGGAPEVLAKLHVVAYVDNGLDLGKKPVERARLAAVDAHTTLHVVDPQHVKTPLGSTPQVKLTPIVPTKWTASCKDNPNDCSIALRIDYCASSVLFTGDAEHDEEAAFPIGSPVTLLQVGHHGSETSSSAAFLEAAHPKYAVISAGKPGEGTNATYCHPRAATVAHLGDVLAAPALKNLRVFDGQVACKAATADQGPPSPTP